MKDFESYNFFRHEYVFLRYLHKNDTDYSSERSPHICNCLKNEYFLHLSMKSYKILLSHKKLNFPKN